MLPNTLVTGIATRNGAVVGVETEHGTIRCETVVDAAGAWLRAVAALTGAKIAVVPTRHQLLITEPIEGVDVTQPITRIIDANVYARPDEGGLMLGGYEQNPATVRCPGPAGAFRYRRSTPRSRRAARFCGCGTRAAAGVSECAREDQTSGAPRWIADDDSRRRTYRGAGAGVRGLYVAGGCCVGGLSMAPAIGEALAAWITDGAPPLDLSPLAPGREGTMDEEALRVACRLQYAHHYWEHVPPS